VVQVFADFKKDTVRILLIMLYLVGTGNGFSHSQLRKKWRVLITVGQ